MGPFTIGSDDGQVKKMSPDSGKLAKRWAMGPSRFRMGFAFGRRTVILIDAEQFQQTLGTIGYS